MLNLKNKLTNLSHKQIIIIGVICAVVGLSLLSFNYINAKINYAYDYMNIKLLETERPELTEAENPTENENSNLSADAQNNNNASTETQNPTPTAKPKPVSIKNTYVGYLEIPKLGFKRGFAGKGSKANTVNQNITVLNASDYPTKPYGNVIIAGHSGNSSVAFFKDLYKLEKGDTASLYYGNKKYTYQIVNIYLQPKLGTLSIYRDKGKKTLTLITCTKDDDKNQTVYIAEVIKEENY